MDDFGMAAERAATLKRQLLRTAGTRLGELLGQPTTREPMEAVSVSATERNNL